MTKPTTTDQAPFAMSTQSFEAMSDAIATAAERTRGLVETGLATWGQEAERFVEEMAQQARLTLDDLANCKTPLEVMAVEQDWLQARAKAYMDASVRFAHAFADAAKAPDQKPAL
ncbi:MAG TPA: hypothetical protein VG939_04805 [Caulobacteraceae bacterium]|nr:hypothetical protein [Caulobacteraceae bacterium]